MSQNVINVTVGSNGTLSQSSLTFSSDKSFVDINGSTLTINAYYKNTQIVLTPASGLKLSVNTSSNSSAGETEFAATQDSPGSNQVSIDVTNNQNLQNATYNGVTVEYLFTLQDNARRQANFSCWVTAVPWQLVTVSFQESSPQFSYSGAIDNTQSPPSITVEKEQGLLFTLDQDSVDRGTTFYTDPDNSEYGPFKWNGGAPDKCMVDMATDGTTAVLSDLYTDPSKTSHGFQLMVMYNGQQYTSEDPTIINADPPQT